MTARDDPWDLARFVAAQRGVFEAALVEVASGRKRSHWMWFVFPQVAGLGKSAMAQRYALSGREEASAYLDHPLLGPRLREIAQALLGVEGRTAHEIFGTPDDLKLRSCCTLFAAVAPPGSVFEQVLAKYFDGQSDPQTVRLLGQG
jgi:uncharacterized protein (DUF1810 family)